MNNEVYFISGNTTRTILSSFYLVIDNKDEEIFKLLNSFLHRQLSQTYDSDNEKAFDNLSTMLPYYYEYALQKLASSINYRDIYELCSDRAVRGIKERLSVGRYREEGVSVDFKIKSNKYTKILLNRFSEIINVCLRNKDLKKLPFILNQLHHVSDSYNYNLTKLKFTILDNKSKKPTGDELKKLSELEKQYAIEGFTDNTV